jgi:Fe-Mn family superoxide dismutase
MYETKNYSHLKGIGRISDEAFAMHLKLYEGYVKNTNSLLAKMKQWHETLTPEQKTEYMPEFSEMQRRFGWEFNGMRNHEIFFDALTTEVEGGNEIEGQIKLKIEEDFGSVEAWKKQFVSIAKMRGIGWAILVQDNKTGKLLNSWVNEHDAGMLTDVTVILNIDMFEHAFIKDFGTDRAPYIDSIFEHINWEVVSERLK